MKRLLVALLALALSVAVLPACDSGEAEGDGAEGQSEQQEQQEESGDDEEAEEQEQAQQAGDGEVATEFAAVLTRIMSFMSEGTNYQCECSPEMMGFESTEECMEATGGDQEEAMAEFETCTAEALASGEEPPAGVNDAITCASDAADSVDECLTNLRDEHEDICSEEAGAAFQGCFAQIETGMDECAGDEDGELEAWMESVDAEMETCMAQVMGM